MASLLLLLLLLQYFLLVTVVETNGQTSCSALTHGGEQRTGLNQKLDALPCRDPRSGLSEIDPITYTCPNGFVDGSTCNVSCADGSQLAGPTSVSCGASGTSGEPGIYGGRQWTRHGEMVPYCQEKCSPGQKSATGNQPCELCPYGSYQSDYGQTSCDLCPYGMWTIIEGAVNKSECTFFAWSFTPQTNVPRPKMNITEKNNNAYTIIFWIRLRQSNEKRMGLDFFINPTGQNIADAANVRIRSYGFFILPVKDTTSTIIRSWYHVAIVFDSKGSCDDDEVILYVNAELKEMAQVCIILQLHNNDTIHFDFLGQATFWSNISLEVYGLQMIESALEAGEISLLATNCGKTFASNILVARDTDTYNDFHCPRSALCDVPNACHDNPCGKYGTCVEWSGFFTCECDQPWTGDLCDILLDYCLSHSCAHGATCINTFEHLNYTCMCEDGYTGPLCSEVIGEPSADSSAGDRQVVGIAGVAGGFVFLISVILLVVYMILRKQRMRRKQIVVHPSHIPAAGGERDDYMQMDNEPYDEIEDDPYAICQDTVLDEDSDGYLLARNAEFIKGTTQAHENNGISSGTSEQLDRDVTQPKPKPEDSTSQTSSDNVFDGYIQPVHVEYFTGRGEIMDSPNSSSIRMDDGMLLAQPKSKDEKCKKSPSKRELPAPGIFDNDGVVSENPNHSGSTHQDDRPELYDKLRPGSCHQGKYYLLPSKEEQPGIPESNLQRNVKKDSDHDISPHVDDQSFPPCLELESKPGRESSYSDKYYMAPSGEDPPYYTDPDIKRTINHAKSSAHEGEENVPLYLDLMNDPRPDSKYYLLPDTDEPPYYTNPNLMRNVGLDIDQDDDKNVAPCVELKNNSRVGSGHSDKYYLFPNTDDPPYNTNSDIMRNVGLDIDQDDDKNVAPCIELKNNSRSGSSHSDKYYLFPNTVEPPYYTNPDLKRNDSLDIDQDGDKNVAPCIELKNNSRPGSSHSDKYYLFPNTDEPPYYTKPDLMRNVGPENLRL